MELLSIFSPFVAIVTLPELEFFTYKIYSRLLEAAGRVTVAGLTTS